MKPYCPPRICHSHWKWTVLHHWWGGRVCLEIKFQRFYWKCGCSTIRSNKLGFDLGVKSQACSFWCQICDYDKGEEWYIFGGQRSVSFSFWLVTIISPKDELTIEWFLFWCGWWRFPCPCLNFNRVWWSNAAFTILKIQFRLQLDGPCWIINNFPEQSQRHLIFYFANRWSKFLYQWFSH